MKQCAICGETENNCFSGDKIKVNGTSYTICFSCASNWNNFREIAKNSKFTSIDQSLYEDVRGYLTSSLASNADIIQEIKDYIVSEVIKIDTISVRKVEKIKEDMELADRYNALMLTTGYEFQGYTVTKYIKVISGETVLGTGFLSELDANISDFFGMQCDLFSNKLVNAKDAAQEKLMQKACSCGANAIIGLDFDYITLYANILGVIANGTAVQLEKQ